MLDKMRAWAKRKSHYTHSQLAFALLSLFALVFVAWSRTDFNSEAPPLPYNSSQNATIYMPIAEQPVPAFNIADPIAPQSKSNASDIAYSIVSKKDTPVATTTSSSPQMLFDPLLQSVQPLVTVNSELLRSNECTTLLVLSVCGL
jgi:hypothetical protein